MQTDKWDFLEKKAITLEYGVKGIVEKKKAQYEKTHKGTDGSVNVTLNGNGPSTVCVYIDNVLRQEIPIDFK